VLFSAYITPSSVLFNYGSHILVMMRFENMAYGVALSFIVIIKQL